MYADVVPAPVLSIRDKRNPGNAVTLWTPGGVASVVGAIQEGRDYILELANITQPDAAQLFIDDTALDALRSHNDNTARWQWTPGFYAGAIDLRIQLADNATVRLDLVTDPDLRKLTRADFNTMVQDILQDTMALFAFSSFRIGVGRGSGANLPPIARLELLRSKIEEIVEVATQINARPVQVLRSENHALPASRARNVTAAELLTSMQRGDLGLVTDEQVRRRLPRELEGHYPRNLQKRLKTGGLDIREHQEIKSALRQWRSVLDFYASLIRRSAGRAANHTEPSGSNYTLWADRCQILSRRLSHLLALPLFSGVTDRNVLPTISPIFRNKPPYRRFFRLHQDIALGISNVFGDFLQLPLARTHDLYELWCFFRIIRVLAARHGSAVVKHLFDDYAPATGSLTLPRGHITIPLPDGKIVSFQQTWVEFWHDSRGMGSISRPMRPDISVELGMDTDVTSVIVLDSKYRVDNQLNDAIGSIHMYSDALVVADMDDLPARRRLVTAAYILTPHVASTDERTPWSTQPMPGRLFHRDYRGAFRIGAVTMQPGMPLEEIATLLDEILT